ncbi:beta-lactamase/transpeptidase-like protein [Delitschia confertaspora ATCC 74209]|uniref:Beta-lactamase/transpeptidase-like protein n=1 Tax=Delitschia confertaspora ATCC 74209 TaxID=1513339 RepID=A0A9P4JKA6_9PLEO|nr:beta-lactamase/transpeptidase-like protein [Delitschia confertaspora ATCC 74209]
MVNKDSVFRLASCTKIVTVLCALILVSQFQLSLDDPEVVERVLSELWTLDIITEKGEEQKEGNVREKAVPRARINVQNKTKGQDSTTYQSNAMDQNNTTDRSNTTSQNNIEVHSLSTKPNHTTPQPTTSVPFLSAPSRPKSPKSAPPFLLKNRTNPITLRHLLTHTSGVGYDILSPLLKAWRHGRDEIPCALTAPLLKAIATSLVFEPGEGWGYGAGLDWVGILVGRVSGLSLQNFIATYILTPLGIPKNSIGFHKDSLQGPIVPTALRSEFLVPYVDPGVQAGAERDERGGGGLYASPDSFIRILHDLIREEPVLLPPDLRDMLFAPELPEGSAPLQALRESPLLRPYIKQMGLEPEALNHSLGGIYITQDCEDIKYSAEGKGFKAIEGLKGTVMWDGAFNCRWIANREKGVVGVYASSLLPVNDEVSQEVMGAWVREVLERAGRMRGEGK